MHEALATTLREEAPTRPLKAVYTLLRAKYYTAYTLAKLRYYKANEIVDGFGIQERRKLSQPGLKQDFPR